MVAEDTCPPVVRRPLRLWPGVALAVIQCLAWGVLPIFLPEQGMYWFLGTFLCGVAILIWWTFLSRADRLERWCAAPLIIAVLFLTSRCLHVSVAKAGMGMLFLFYSVPLVGFVFVLAAVVGSRLAARPRRAILAAAVLLSSGGWTLIRIDGIRAAGGLQPVWRWSPTSEERLLARGGITPLPVQAATANETAAVTWPGFRGPKRDSVVSGVRIDIDWAGSPPTELWRRPAGPAWSSFAVHGDLLYTQEQYGDQEVVVCYRATNGEPVWRHTDATRFWEANAGPGPRATPTLDGGRVFTFGGTGILNALDAASGALLWSRKVAAETETKVPYWGFACSPLVVGDAVIVAPAGRLAAYDAATGNQRWLGPPRRGSYASPHLLAIGGVEQLLVVSSAGATSVSPADGSALWEHEWQGVGILQPALTDDGGVLFAVCDASGGMGVRRLSVTRDGGEWKTEARWTSRGLKPYFNDFVIHAGHAFGFDGAILACIGMDDGVRRWKGGRYGNGQLLLLADQDLLLVLSESGELALVRAAVDAFTELARFKAIEGKTWNHPVLAGDTLFVRNAEEMAAFRLRVMKN